MKFKNIYLFVFYFITSNTCLRALYREYTSTSSISRIWITGDFKGLTTKDSWDVFKNLLVDLYRFGGLLLCNEKQILKSTNTKINISSDMSQKLYILLLQDPAISALLQFRFSDCCPGENNSTVSLPVMSNNVEDYHSLTIIHYHSF